MAEDLIIQNKEKLNLIAEALLEKETLDSAEIAALMEGKSLAELEEERKLEENKIEAKKIREEKKKEIAGKVKVVFRPDKGEICREPRGEV